MFNKIDHGKDGALQLSHFVQFIETHWEGFHSEELTDHLQKLYPNESGGLDRSAFVRWYVDKDVSLDSTGEVERVVHWGCKVSLMYLQREIFLNIHALKRERN